VIWVERVGQRKIVIGTKGARLKSVGAPRGSRSTSCSAAAFHLNTWVKVREGWSDDDRMLRQLGHEPP
jgi:GTP-binding protein Era